eukprot:m.81054 g.81054  ORF g.81054 m.81054 type:complete len:606 (-) comp8068_c0_seq3:3204-5021(-)
MHNTIRLASLWVAFAAPFVPRGDVARLHEPASPPSSALGHNEHCSPWTRGARISLADHPKRMRREPDDCPDLDPQSQIAYLAEADAHLLGADAPTERTLMNTAHPSRAPLALPRQHEASVMAPSSGPCVPGVHPALEQCAVAHMGVPSSVEACPRCSAAGRQLTALRDCVPGTDAAILGIVLQTVPVRDIRTRTGEDLQLASVLLGDETAGHFRLTFWAALAPVVDRLRPGDAIVVSHVRIRAWQARPVGSATSRSIVANLRHLRHTPDLLVVSCAALQRVQAWGRTQHAYLYCRPAHAPVIPCTVAALCEGDLVDLTALVHAAPRRLPLLPDRPAALALAVRDGPGAADATEVLLAPPHSSPASVHVLAEAVGRVVAVRRARVQRAASDRLVLCADGGTTISVCSDGDVERQLLDRLDRLRPHARTVASLRAFNGRAIVSARVRRIIFRPTDAAPITLSSETAAFGSTLVAALTHRACIGCLRPVRRRDGVVLPCEACPLLPSATVYTPAELELVDPKTVGAGVWVHAGPAVLDQLLGVSAEDAATGPAALGLFARVCRALFAGGAPLALHVDCRSEADSQALIARFTGVVSQVGLTTEQMGLC